jgi:hypothetical protein
MRRRLLAMSTGTPSRPHSSETRGPARVRDDHAARDVVAVAWCSNPVPQLLAADPAHEGVRDPELACQRQRGAVRAPDQLDPLHVSPRCSASIRSAARRTVAICSSSRNERRGRSALGAADFSGGTSPESTPRRFASRNTPQPGRPSPNANAKPAAPAPSTATPRTHSPTCSTTSARSPATNHGSGPPSTLHRPHDPSPTCRPPPSSCLVSNSTRRTEPTSTTRAKSAANTIQCRWAKNFRLDPALSCQGLIATARRSTPTRR